MLAEAEAKDAKEDKLYGKDKRGDELSEELQERGKGNSTSMSNEQVRATR